MSMSLRFPAKERHGQSPLGGIGANSERPLEPRWVDGSEEGSLGSKH